MFFLQTAIRYQRWHPDKASAIKDEAMKRGDKMTIYSVILAILLTPILVITGIFVSVVSVLNGRFFDDW
jgi:hypothetical protein